MGKKIKGIKREREEKPKFGNPKNIKKGGTHKEKSMKTGLESRETIEGKMFYFYICFLLKSDCIKY